MSGLRFRRPLFIALLVVALGALPAVSAVAAPATGTVDASSFIASLWQRILAVQIAVPAARSARQPARVRDGGAPTDVPVVRDAPVDPASTSRISGEDGTRLDPDG